MKASNISIKKEDLEFMENQEELNKDINERAEQERQQKEKEELDKEKSQNDLFVGDTATTFVNLTEMMTFSLLFVVFVENGGRAEPEGEHREQSAEPAASRAKEGQDHF